MAKQPILKFVKIVTIVIVLTIGQTIADQFDGFKALSHTKGSSNFTRKAYVAAITECSIRCRMKQNCFAANWKNNVCELLDESVGSPLNLVEADGWAYIYIDMCASTPCKNGGPCTPLVGAYACTCVGGFSGATCDDRVCDLTINDICIVMSLEQVSWHSAKDRCSEAGGKLAEMCDANTNGQIWGILSGIPYPHRAWIGGTDEASEGDWTWATGSCGFGNFGTHCDADQPDNWAGDEHCLLMQSDK